MSGSGRVPKLTKTYPAAAAHPEPDVPGENMNFALRASASAISVFAARVRIQFLLVTGWGRMRALAFSRTGHSPKRSYFPQSAGTPISEAPVVAVAEKQKFTAE